MDSLDRMYQLLARTIRAQFPQYETQPFDVAELYQTILPYRHNRRELGLDSNEDYEIVLTELLSGARDYLIVDERIRDTLKAELASPNPDPSAFKEFADASVALAPAALARVDSSQPMRVSGAAPRASRGGLASAASAVTTPMPPVARAPSPSSGPGVSPPSVPVSSPVVATPAKMTTPRPGDRCRSCDQVLPAGREITFCPHCGQNLTTMSCLACGSELELGWKFCPVCGRPATAHR